MKIYGYGKQSISQDDIDAVVEVLHSDFLNNGPKTEEFERKICEYTGAAHCIAVSNGTGALHLVAHALDLTGHEVLTTPITFLASANCARYVGASVNFADIDIETGNMEAEQIEEKITPLTKAIIPVHFAGQSCDMKAISKFRKDAYIIEDAAHALGSDYEDTKVGSCKYSDAAIFSFHPVKNITTGEGGAITTNDRTLAEKLKKLRAHGMNRDSNSFHYENEGRWYYEMPELGYNYRITEMQAAMGISQLKRIEQFKEKRRYVTDKYKEIFAADERITFLKEREYSNACWHICPIFLDFPRLAIDKRKFFDDLYDAGLRLAVQYIPVHLHPYYQECLGFRRGQYPLAEKYYAQTVSLPLYYDLSDDDIECISERFLKVLNSHV
ncbi:MAG: UDP-4-amino-4,6-dideoxy-N-acetyl-beta-L-altrosamine transaminase [Holosporaceae bacterium]|jgi:UDP-4-amino-4,6-dideoxy-N-acetyl-beta-L-altrosamine transaminase|nr:UDP-4-amino-4,6-dideoxy-N-acetyl-beta-L-altrosamine transaminase [Holosporaceae bacterium]